VHTRTPRNRLAKLLQKLEMALTGGGARRPGTQRKYVCVRMSRCLPAVTKFVFSATAAAQHPSFEGA
jgi:hypothetical protein